MMLMELLPISPFAYSYAYFGVMVFLPQYLRIWLTCKNETSYQATLHLSRLIGDVMRYFILGVMVLCVHSYQVSPELLWGNFLFIFFGYAYLLYVISVKYELFWRNDLPYNDSHMLTLNAWSFLLTLVLGMGIVLIISYHSHKRTMPKEEGRDAFSEAPSELEITGVTAKRTDLSNFKIWWDTVNAFHNMQGRRKIVIIIFVWTVYVMCPHDFKGISSLLAGSTVLSAGQHHSRQRHAATHAGLVQTCRLPQPVGPAVCDDWSAP